MFANFNGSKSQEPNVSAYRYTTTETGFLAGVIAALESKTGTVGYIAGSSAAHIQDANNAFKDGVHYINPNYTALDAFTDSMGTGTLRARMSKLWYAEISDADLLEARKTLGKKSLIPPSIIASADGKDIPFEHPVFSMLPRIRILLPPAFPPHFQNIELLHRCLAGKAGPLSQDLPAYRIAGYPAVPALYRQSFRVRFQKNNFRKILYYSAIRAENSNTNQYLLQLGYS